MTAMTDLRKASLVIGFLSVVVLVQSAALAWRAAPAVAAIAAAQDWRKLALEFQQTSDDAQANSERALKVANSCIESLMAATGEIDRLRRVAR